ncbi:hypothetical protein SKAU_G00123430 [Synaphobranchus kaupii]|uniref:Uncharacterized protein n=1 Tax=Synaphobranchus kaupii TaxID=118154 RepID=A0A9Q1J0I2_SYNKA|nr:hypothetical protein SKAU_G00123430 [Synaphobranchus kaupii]
MIGVSDSNKQNESPTIQTEVGLRFLEEERGHPHLATLNHERRPRPGPLRAPGSRGVARQVGGRSEALFEKAASGPVSC